MQILDAIARRLGYVRAEKIRRRAFSAASVNRLTADWVSAPRSANAEIRDALRIARARSRDLYQNNDYVRRFLGLVQTNVVGHQGVILQAKSQDPDGTLDALANTAIEESWARWGRAESCDTAAMLSWRQFQRAFILNVARDGEVFVYHDQPTRQNPYGYAIRFIDPEFVDVAYSAELNNGNIIRMGVEVSPSGRPVAYHVKTSDPRAENYYSYRGQGYMRVQAGRITHHFLPEYLNATRGMPWVTTSMMHLNMLGGYEEAELVAARTGASKMGFFVEADGGEYLGDAETTDGNLISDASPGQFEKLPSGVTFQSYDPVHPTNAYEGFVKQVLRGIASGLGVSYNSLANDLEGVNYSSLRQGALEERAVWMALQDWMIESFVDPVYRQWLQSALEFGAVTVVGRPLKLERIEKFQRVSWQARRWAWVDPLKEMAAHEKAIALGLKSRSEIIREQGRDPEDVWLEIQSENARMQELGIVQQQQPAEAGFLVDDEDGED